MLNILLLCLTDLLNDLSVSHIDEVGDYEIPKEKKNTVTVGQITSTQSEVESNTGKCLPICVSQTQANRGHILYDYGDLFVCVSFFSHSSVSMFTSFDFFPTLATHCGNIRVSLKGTPRQ